MNTRGRGIAAVLCALVVGVLSAESAFALCCSGEFRKIDPAGDWSAPNRTWFDYGWSDQTCRAQRPRLRADGNGGCYVDVRLTANQCSNSVFQEPRCNLICSPAGSRMEGQYFAYCSSTGFDTHDRDFGILACEDNGDYKWFCENGNNPRLVESCGSYRDAPGARCERQSDGSFKVRQVDDCGCERFEPCCVPQAGRVCQTPGNGPRCRGEGRIACDGSCEETVAPPTEPPTRESCESPGNGRLCRGQGHFDCRDRCVEDVPGPTTPADPSCSLGEINALLAPQGKRATALCPAQAVRDCDGSCRITGQPPTEPVNSACSAADTARIYAATGATPLCPVAVGLDCDGVCVAKGTPPAAPAPPQNCFTPGNGVLCPGEGFLNCQGICIESKAPPAAPTDPNCTAAMIDSLLRLRGKRATPLCPARAVRDCNNICRILQDPPARPANPVCSASDAATTLAAAGAGAFCPGQVALNCDGACEVTVPPPLNAGQCDNGYTGPNTAVCLRGCLRDCDSNQCRDCRLGERCSAGALLCPSPDTLGGPEVCNGIDDDCDTDTDEGTVCAKCASRFFDPAERKEKRAKDFVGQEILPQVP